MAGGIQVIITLSSMYDFIEWHVFFCPLGENYLLQNNIQKVSSKVATY